MTLTLNHLTVTTAPAPAASVVILREAIDGFEVLLLKRHAASGVLGGAFVFPGGKVDPGDAAPGVDGSLDRTPAELHAALGEPSLAPAEAVAVHVAAIREAYEESGVLLADAPAVEPGAVVVEADLHRRPGFAFHSLRVDAGLTLRTRDLTPWSRWITPHQPSVTHRRFDTRFFVARVDAAIQVLHDGIEAVESCWWRPAEALQRYWDREIVLAAPQIMSLAHLAHHRTIEAVVAEARACGVRLIEPHTCEIDGIRTSCYPGDPLHPVGLRTLPGPTRLSFRDGRFEPAGGLAALLPDQADRSG